MARSHEPYTLLVEMANRSLAHPRGLPAQEKAKATWTGVGFVLLGQLMVAPMGEVVELLHVPNWTVLPGVKGWVKGVANVRGRLLPIIDTEEFLGGQLVGPTKLRRVLAVECGELFTGLMVSDVIGMMHFPVDSYIPKIPEKAAELAAYSTGAYVHEGKVWTVFSPFKLAGDSRFINAAA
jgi:twitching motility protein PilI